MKRLLAFLLVIAMLLCLCACATAPATESSSEPSSQPETALPADGTKPLLYRVTTDGDAVLYLFGSIHATDDRAYPLPDYIMDAYNESDYLCVEFDAQAFMSDLSLQMEMTRLLLAPDGKTTADFLGEALYEEAKAFLTEYNLYSPLYDVYLPVMWFSLIENALAEEAQLDTGTGIDSYFLEKAYEDGKDIVEVESVQMQYDLLLGFSNDLIKLLIESLITYPQESIDGTAELYEVWLRGDAEALAAGLEDDTSDMPAEELALYEEYITALSTDRNIAMTQVAEDCLAKGRTGFFVVGAAHIVGQGALVDLLTQQGYTVEIVKP